MDARIVSATNSDPQKDIEDQRLRADLYYRLNVVPIEVPPLRERLSDVPLLATAALRRHATHHGRSFKSIDQEAIRSLQQHHWPGNVRELFHMIERAVVLNDAPVLTVDMLPPNTPAIRTVEPSPVKPVVETPPNAPDSDAVVPLAEQERRAILQALDACGSAARAARALGISEATIYRRLREYGLTQSRE